MILNVSYFPEHMEEDDESSKTIPRWVELEYKVRYHTSLKLLTRIRFYCDLI